MSGGNIRYSDEEARELLLSSIAHIAEGTSWSEGRIVEEFDAVFGNNNLYLQCYEPDPLLLDKLSEYQNWLLQYQDAKDAKNGTGEQRRLEQKAGKLLEEVTLLAFRCLRGVDSFKSFQSPTSQYDLLISGSTPRWSAILKYLHLPQESRSFLVEVKNTKDKVSEAQFSRLCSILDLKLATTCSLGVFVTRTGATGFPDESKVSRQRELRDSRATQALFHAKSKKCVIVLDQNDLNHLNERGALVRILEAQVRDLEELSGIDIQLTDDWSEIDLPPHLAQHISK